jgi:hypothetical protein
MACTGNVYSCRLGAVHPRLTVSVLYEVEEDLLQEYIYFQFCIRFYNFQNQRYSTHCYLKVTIAHSILRVITKRLPTTANMHTFLSSVDSDAAVILLGKKLILDARKVDENDEIVRQLYPYTCHMSLILRVEMTHCVEYCSTVALHTTD